MWRGLGLHSGSWLFLIASASSSNHAPFPHIPLSEPTRPIKASGSRTEANANRSSHGRPRESPASTAELVKAQLVQVIGPGIEYPDLVLGGRAIDVADFERGDSPRYTPGSLRPRRNSLPSLAVSVQPAHHLPFVQVMATRSSKFTDRVAELGDLLRRRGRRGRLLPCDDCNSAQTCTQGSQTHRPGSTLSRVCPFTVNFSLPSSIASSPLPFISVGATADHEVVRIDDVTL